MFEIGSCTEIIANDTLMSCVKNYNLYILGDLHPLRGKSGLDTYDLF